MKPKKKKVIRLEKYKIKKAAKERAKAIREIMDMMREMNN